ncbi:MAG: chorismate-binding protein [Spirochaetota bacterium]
MRTDSVIKVIPGERFTPCGLADKCQAKVMFESSSLMRGRERYSILLLDEAFRIVQQEKEVYLVKAGRTEELPYQREDILDVLSHIAAENPSLHQDLPTPTGGFGYLSYEFARFCDSIHLTEKEDPYSQYDAQFIFGHIQLIFDHATDLIYILGLNYDEDEIDLEKQVAETAARIEDFDFNYLIKRESLSQAVIQEDPEGNRRFLQGVEHIKDQITSGNLLQGVLSRRLSIKTDLSAFEAYKQLRSVNPSPYMFYIDFGDFQLFGASPEVMVKVKEGRVTLRPIAGTRRRGKSQREDIALEQELLGDEKECAEHLMLVDLARNDLARVCKPETVSVPEYMSIERYSHVMHIVSEVTGDLSPGVEGPAVVRACFPAGTVSGAPKIRAVETIDRLETERRGFYAGLIGYMEAGGNLDTCISIRTAMRIQDTIILQAGAGIVYDSVAERELEETNEKLRAMAASLGVEV